MKLSRKILAASLLPFLTIIGIYHILSSNSFTSHLVHIFRQQADASLSRAEDDLRFFLLNNEYQLKLLATIRPPNQQRPVASRVALRGLLNNIESFFQISAINTNGKEWLRVTKFPTLKDDQGPLNLFNSPVYQQPLLNKAPYLGTITREDNFPLPFINLSVPVKDYRSGRVSGIIWVKISFQGIQTLLERYLPVRGKIMLVGPDNGEVLAQADDTRIDFKAAEKEVIQEVLQNNKKRGWLEKRRANSKATFIYRKITLNDLDFILLYYQPNNTIYFLADQLKVFNFYTMLGGIVLFFLTSFILVRLIITPLSKLTDQINGLGHRYRPREEKELSLPHKKHGDEVEQLRHAFTFFQKQLSLYHDEIESFNQRLKQQVKEKTQELSDLNLTLENANENLQLDIAKRVKVEKELEKHQQHLEMMVTERTEELSKANEALRGEMEERRKMENELIKVKKLESISVLAGGIAHDFNNILAAIMGNISLAAALLKSENEEVYKLMIDAESASLRAKDLTNQLLTFSKGGDPIKKITSITEVIKGSAEFILRGSNVKCHYDIPTDLWSVEIDTSQMSQVIQNIILNSRHAMPEGGTIEISLANMVKDETHGLPLPSGNYVKITVRDSGVGIPSSLIDKVFDPYFTTKHEGSGLGLAITHSIISKHDGHITVESEQSKGTLFSIYLPASKKKYIPEQKDTKPIKVTAKGRALIMDDEEVVQHILKTMLTHLGYDVICSSNGSEALDIYQQNLMSGKTIDIVILDLTIPGRMGGKETIPKLLKIDPGAKVLVASGYSNDPIMSNYKDYGFLGAIRKPFTLNELSEVINIVLGD